MIRKILTTVVFMFFCNLAIAASSPENMLQGVANQLIAELEKHKNELGKSNAVVNNIVSRVVLPHVDQQRMATLVVGHEAWQNASAAERTAFVKEFRTVVLRTYASAFSNYKNETVDFKPVREQGADVEVQSVINRPGNSPIPVSYRLASAGGAWKIYDFSVSGVSMVNSFKAQFAGASQQGLASLTRQLQQHNQHHAA